jgi:hypothetical protein
MDRNDLDRASNDLVPANTAAADGEFVELALRYLDGLTDAAEAQRMGELLSASAALREQYVELCATRSLMAEQVWSAPLPALGANERPIDAPIVLPLGVTPGVPLFGKFFSGGAASAPMLGLAFVACVALATFAVDRVRESIRQNRHADGSDGIATARSMFATDYVATITRTANCRWTLTGGSTEVGSRLAKSEIHLASGVAEIVFDQGTRVILEGPAYFTPQSVHAGFLRSGKLVAQVPPRVESFTIQTPSGVVTNRSAEYGIVVDENGATDLHVFAGDVEVALRRDLFSPVEILEYRDGQAVRVVANNDSEPLPIALDADLFVRRVQPVKLELPASLISYWNFDEQGGPAGDLVGRNDGALQGVARTKGLIGRGAIEFSDRHGQMVNVGGGDGSFTCTDGITIEALFTSRWDGKTNLDADGHNYDEIFRKGNAGALVLLSLQYDGNKNRFANPPSVQGPVLSFGLCVNGKYEELDMPLDGEDGRPSLADITDGRPHHVAATYDAASGEKAIYVDGGKRYSHRYAAGSALATESRRAAAIGNAADLPWEPFHGTIDEVAVYRAALAEEEIARHWERVQRGECYFERVDAPLTSTFGPTVVSGAARGIEAF